jgi:hypothetical protein
MTPFGFLRGRSSGTSSSKRPIPPMSLFAYIPIPPQTFFVFFCSCLTIDLYIGTDSLSPTPHLTSASHVTANGSTAIFLWFRRPPSCLVHCPFPPAASGDTFRILDHVLFSRLSPARGGAGGPPSMGRSPDHTWAPSPPPGRVRLGGTMGTHADWTFPSCGRRFQLSALTWFQPCNRWIGADTPTTS